MGGVPCGPHHLAASAAAALAALLAALAPPRRPRRPPRRPRRLPRYAHASDAARRPRPSRRPPRRRRPPRARRIHARRPGGGGGSRIGGRPIAAESESRRCALWWRRGFCLAVLGKSRTRRGAGGVSLAVWRMWARVVSRRQPTRDSMRLDPVVSPGRAVDCHRRLLSFAIRGVGVTGGLVAPRRLLWIRTPAKRLEQPSDRQPRVTNLESRAAHKQRGVSSPHAQPRRLLS